MKESYEINDETLLIIPYDYGKSKFYEYDDEFIVDMVPLTIIKKSCLFFGASFEGRRDASKDIIGVDMKVPIIIEESRDIIFFPVSSCISKNSIWISYQNLMKYSKVDLKSCLLYFKNDKSIRLGTKYNLVDNQVIRCIKLDTMLNKRKKFSKSISKISEFD